MAQSSETKLNKRFDQNIEVTGTIKLGVREQTTPGDYASNKITLIPPYHTGGPFYIKTRDDANDAYLTVSYGTSEVLKIKHDGTLSINGSNVLTSYTETDPTVPSYVKSITTTNISNWNTAYSWGNHAGLYLGATSKAADSNLLDGIDSNGFIRDLGDVNVTNFDTLPDGWLGSNETTATNQPYANHHNTFTITNDASAGRKTQLFFADSPGGGFHYRVRQGDTTGWHPWEKIWTNINLTNVSQLTNDSGYITGVSWSDITSKPSTFTPSSHEHTYIRNVTSPAVTAADSAMPSLGYSLQHFLGYGPSNNDGHILAMTWTGSSAYGAQIWIDTDPNNIMAFRSRSSTGVWTGWNTLVHSGNISSQSVSYASNAGTLDGIDSSSFLRSDTSDSMYGTLAIHTSQVWGDTTQGLTTGSLHLDPNSGTDHAGGAITWGASDASAGTNAQAGIYIRSDGGYGTRMYLSTTDSYATGSKTSIAIQQNGDVNIVRGNLYGAGSLVGANIRSDYRYDYNGNFMWRVGTNAGTTTARHLNLANTTADPSDISSSHQTTGITWGQRTDNNPYYIIRCRPEYNNGYSTHSRLDLSWHTGIEIGAASNYGGTRFFNNSSFTGGEIMRVGSGNSNVYINNTGEAGADFRAPTFYDSNNTAWYTNPAGRSLLNTLQLGGSSSDTTNLKLDVQGNMAIRNSSGLYFGVSTNNYNSWTTRLYASGSTQYFNGQEFRFDNQGYGSTTFATIDSQGVTSNIFRDRDNTNFYLDPASTSKLYSINDQNDCTYIAYKHSGSDFADGTLVTTNIPSSATNGASFILDATGKSYSTDSPFSFTVQGYLYNNTIINYSGLHYGKPGFGSMKVFDYGGYLAFWWPRVSYWNSFEVRVRDAGGGAFNRVVNITNSTEPSSSKKVTVTMYNSAVYGRNYGNDILYATAYHDSEDTAYYLNPQGFSNLGKIKFNDTVSQGTPGGDATIGRNYAYNTLELKGYGSELMIGAQSTSININYRYCNGVGSNAYTPQTWYWRAGTSSNWSDHHFGNVYAGTYYDRNDTSKYLTRYTGDYGAWRMGGSQGGYSGLEVDGGMNLMIHTNGASGPCGFWAGNWSILTYVNSNQFLYYDGNEKFKTLSDGAQVTGTLYVTGDVIAYYSDIRLKQDIENIDNAVDKIKKLRGVTYTWNNKEVNVVKERAGTRDIGLIAQEVEEVEPLLVTEYQTQLNTPSNDPEEASEFVPEFSESYKTIKYDKIVALLIEATKEQQDTIDKLSKEIKELKKLINP